MWKMATAVLLVVLSFTTQCSEKSWITELLEFDAARKAAFAQEEKKLWKQVNWQTAADAAMELARKENKPILVFILVRENGSANSDQC